jgi:SAM-dependent methyltransferase
MKEERKHLTAPYGHLAHLISTFQDFDYSFIINVRQREVELLKLQEGDRVLDMGCGPGGSFPYLVHAVGPSGQVVGVEISPVISINARKRVEKNGWINVDVIEADARTVQLTGTTVQLTGTFDGLIMFATEVLLLEEALENIFPHLRERSGCCVRSKNVEQLFGKTLEPRLEDALQTHVLNNSQARP